MSTVLQQDSDHKTREAVEAELQWTPQLIDAAQIDVAVRDGVVTLSGEVSTYVQKIAAGKAALRTRDVGAVANDVSVRYNSEMYSDAHLAGDANVALRLNALVPRDDMEPRGAHLAAAVRDVLRTAAYVPEDGVDIEVRDHAVYLSGTAKWNHERVAAERAVEHVAGVHVLRNAIHVAPQVSPLEMRDKVLAALKCDDSPSSHRIDVEVDDGTVTLTGEVASYTDRQLAERTALAMPHVRTVCNQLRIVQT